MFCSLPTVLVAVGLYALAVEASQTTVYQATAAEWTWTGDAKRVARTTLRNACPDISVSDTDFAIVSSSAADEITLTFQSARSVKVFGIIFPTCDSDPVIGTMDVKISSIPSACAARCDTLLAEWNNLDAANSERITLSARTTAFSAPIAIFNATLFSDPVTSGGGGSCFFQDVAALFTLREGVTPTPAGDDTTIKTTTTKITTMTTTASPQSSSGGITTFPDPMREGTIISTSSTSSSPSNSRDETSTTMSSSNSESESVDHGTVTSSAVRSSVSASTTSFRSQRSGNRARIVVPSVVVPLVLIAAVASGAWCTHRRHRRTFEYKHKPTKGNPIPYTYSPLSTTQRNATPPLSALDTPSGKARVENKLAASLRASHSSTSPEPGAVPSGSGVAAGNDPDPDPPLEEIGQAMRRAGFTSRALLESLNRVHARGSAYIPIPTPSELSPGDTEPVTFPPKYVI